MKLLFISLIISGSCFGQSDSARLKVTKARTGADKTYYWLKDVETKENYYTVCACYQKHKKGEIVMIARKDIALMIKSKK